MDSNGQSFFSGRVILGILAGVTASILFISFMRNYVLATVLGMLVAVMIADLEQPRKFAMLGFITGSIAGLYLGARNFLIQGELHMALDYLGLAISMLAGLVLTGLLCALYGFITGKVLILYQKGQGPFF